MRASLAIAILTILVLRAAADIPDAVPDALPDAVPHARIDLTTDAGVAAVAGTWRYSDTRIVESQFRAPDADGQPTGAPVTTYDLAPHAGGADFDDSAWTPIAPESLAQRRGAGRLSFNWYRIRVTVPERVGDFATRGSTVVFETSLDDYAEVWVDGELPRAFAQSGGSVVGGWNARNRLVVGRNVQPGQPIQLAVFGINGPVSDAPDNYIWMRSARLDFFTGSDAPVAVTPQEVNIEVERLDPAIDALVPPNAKLFKLAEGFQFIEGPIWVARAGEPGRLLFSDPNANRIYAYSDEEGLSVFRERSGYDGADVAEYGQPGSNGLALDRAGRVTIAEHGRHRLSRIEADGTTTVLAASYRGKRLNSPNDLVYRRDGSLYFTDPPFGLPRFYDDPHKELSFSGVYRLANGELTLLADELIGPNGIAFSPDERFLYVANWDPARKIVMRYPVRRDGTLGRGEQFFDMGGAPGEEALDGIEIDELGNLYVSGPGGVWVLSPHGTHLGTIRAPKLPANFAWGGPDGRTLYLTARTALYRMPMRVGGVRP
jgi:gluconolactonase